MIRAKELMVGYRRFDVNGPGLAVSEWEFRECMRRVNDVMRQPRGGRDKTIQQIADDYGVTARTLYRWRRAEIHAVEVGGFRALYMVATGQPVRVTAWERAA